MSQYSISKSLNVFFVLADEIVYVIKRPHFPLLAFELIFFLVLIVAYLAGKDPHLFNLLIQTCEFFLAVSIAFQQSLVLRLQFKHIRLQRDTLLLSIVKLYALLVDGGQCSCVSSTQILYLPHQDRLLGLQLLNLLRVAPSRITLLLPSVPLFGQQFQLICEFPDSFFVDCSLILVHLFDLFLLSLHPAAFCPEVNQIFFEHDFLLGNFLERPLISYASPFCFSTADSHLTQSILQLLYLLDLILEEFLVLALFFCGFFDFLLIKTPQLFFELLVQFSYVLVALVFPIDVPLVDMFQRLVVSLQSRQFVLSLQLARHDLAVEFIHQAKHLIGLSGHFQRVIQHDGLPELVQLDVHSQLLLPRTILHLHQLYSLDQFFLLGIRWFFLGVGNPNLQYFLFLLGQKGFSLFW